MPKINRFNGNLRAFGVDAPGTERTVFGEVTQANDLDSQFTSDFFRGWGIVGPSDQPSLQDFNAMGYTLGQVLAYLHQMGVPEYNAAQEFYLNSVTMSGGVAYVSLQNANVGNAPSTNPAWWRELYPQATESLRGTVIRSSNAQAIAGTDDVTAMTPLKVKNAIAQFAGSPPAATETVAGIAEIATQAETNAGVDDARIVTPKKLAALMALTQSVYVSGNLPVAAGTQTPLVHGLGRIPSIIQIDYICTVAQLGWSAGDVLVNASTIRQDVTAGATGRGHYLYDISTTNLTLGTGSGTPIIPNKTTGVMAALTPTSWAVRVTAR